MNTRLACAVVVASLDSTGLAQCDPKQVAKLAAPPIVGAYFGGTNGIVLALDGSTAFVSGSEPFGPPVYGRAAVLYEFVEQSPGVWIKGQTIVAPSYGQIGRTITLDGDRLCAGFDQGGSIVIFERTAGSWAWSTSLAPTIVPGGNWNSEGAEIKLVDDRLFVAVPRAGLGLGLPHDTGAIFVLEHIAGNWVYSSLIVPNVPYAGGQFGRHFDCAHSRIVAFAGEPLSTSVSGVVYVFDFEGGSWSQKARLIPNDWANPSGVGSLLFGSSIAVHDSAIVVGGSPQSLYSFEKLGPFWLQTQKFSAPGALSIGDHVAFSDDRLIASIKASVGSPDSGALIVFERLGTEWIDRMLLGATDPVFGEQIGADDICASGDLAAASSATGHVYLFNTVPNPPPEYGDGCPGSGGITPMLEDLLSYDGCASDGSSISYSISSALGGSLALLLLSNQQISLSAPGNCTLLLAPSAATLSLPLFGVGPGGGAITLNASIPIGFPSIDVFFQAFVIDPGAVQGYCATNGLRLSVE